MNVSADPLIVLAVVDALLVSMFFLFRVLPWSRPGPWRRIWLLASVASLMFMVSEIAALLDGGTGLALSHQVPLFVSILATSACFFMAYLDGYRSAERARALAMTDALTQLPNRRAFEESLKVAAESEEPFSVVYVDLDGFKRINDQLGHDAGDATLRQAGAALRQVLRKSDTAARLGGDEFAMLLRGADATSARVVAERALVHVRAIRVREGAPALSASFGVATCRATPPNAKALLEAADDAMYQAKRAGGNAIAIGAAIGEPRTA